MQVTRQDNQFADAVDKLLAGHRRKRSRSSPRTESRSAATHL